MAAMAVALAVFAAGCSGNDDAQTPEQVMSYLPALAPELLLIDLTQARADIEAAIETGAIVDPSITAASAAQVWIGELLGLTAAEPLARALDLNAVDSVAAAVAPTADRDTQVIALHSRQSFDDLADALVSLDPSWQRADDLLLSSGRGITAVGSDGAVLLLGGSEAAVVAARERPGASPSAVVDGLLGTVPGPVRLVAGDGEPACGGTVAIGLDIEEGVATAATWIGQEADANRIVFRSGTVLGTGDLLVVPVAPAIDGEHASWPIALNPERADPNRSELLLSGPASPYALMRTAAPLAYRC